MDKVEFSRREFLRVSAAAAAGLLVASCAKPAEEEPTAPAAATATPVPAEPTATPKPAETAPELESPVLAAKVASGDLPALDERLPKDPRVHTVYEGVGQYSDTLQVLSTSPGPGWDINVSFMIGMFGETNDGELFPNYAKGFEVSDDAKTYTIHIREGLKWSDGEPFTTEDVRFWHEDDATYEEISPSTPGFGWTVAGEFCKLEIVDDYTFKVGWSVPNKPMVNTFRYWAGMWWNFATGTPSHYMQKFHNKYNPKVEDEATAEGFDTWVQYYGARKSTTNAEYGPEKPALCGWVMHEQTATYTTFERDPFYWGIDPEGRQLPYFDKTRTLFVEDKETYDLKIVAGETDFALSMTRLANLPLYTQSAEDGGFNVYKYKSPRGSDESFCFNRNSKDPAMAEIYRDPRWNQAMSYAINRQEVQEVVFLGTGVPRQAAPNPACSYFKKEWEDFCAEYSPDKANALLDEMGLDKRDADGYRLRPDGETLSVLIELTTATDSPTLEVTQLVAEHWNEVGVKATYKEIERDLLQTRGQANELDVGVWHTDRTNEARGYVIGVSKILPDHVEYAMPATNEWTRWHQTKGEQGEEPPEEWKQHFDDIDAWYTCTTDEKYLELAQKLYDFLILEQLRVIGTVGFTTWPVIAKKSLGNFPTEGYAGDDTGFGRSLFMETWFRKEV